MRIERIEMVGFKSFAEKTVFNFHPGITSIVGPNGCGKSNIVDAFKWVLGEQSAKSLRGDSMEDVIFSGSATKKTKGMAEVTLIISDIIRDASNGSENNGNGDRREVAVTRRLYRSGESEYLMNKVPCRLKDIKNMFLDTGLELKAYSILEQGRIGDIINSKPQDRRFLIEEVAGVMKYKIRKNEALSKLESSKSNLQRLQDIIAEVKRQLNVIDRHAKKAEKYKKLLEEIRDIETRVAKRDFRLLTAEISNLSLSENTLKTREAENCSNLHSNEAAIEEKKRLYVEQDKYLEEIRSRLYALDKGVTEDEGRITLLKKDCENMKERFTSLERQQELLINEKETASALLIENSNRINEMETELFNLRNLLEEKKNTFIISENGIGDMELELESHRKNLFRKAEELSNARNETNQLKVSIDSLNRRAEKNTQDINSINDSITAQSSTIRQTGEDFSVSEEKLLKLKNTKEELSGRLKVKKAELAENEKNLYRLREELAALNSRHESLIEIDRGQMSSVNERIKMVCQVADVLETPQEYETAVEAVLGDKLNAAVVEDHDEISKAMYHIKELHEKRSGFIVINPGSRKPIASSPSGDGIIGEALKFITVKKGFESLAGALLRDVILVKNLETAISLRKSTDEENRFDLPHIVTLEGEVLEPDGMVFGGTDRGVLKVKRQIKEIENEISVNKEHISAAELLIASVRDAIANEENSIISIDGEISGQEKYCHELKVKLESLKEEESRLRKRHDYISFELNDGNREKENLIASLEAKEQQCRTFESEREGLEGQIKSVQAEISEKKESLESMRSELTEIKLHLASASEKLLSVKREIERLKSTLTDIDRKREEIINERNLIDTGISSRQKEISEKEEALKEKVIQVQELQSEASKIAEILEAKTAEISLMEKSHKVLAAELEKARVELNHIEIKKMEHSMKLNYLKEDIHKTYSLDIESADITDSVSAEEEKNLLMLREKMQAIGPVSLGTLDEYEELNSRYEFLSKQRDDLLASIEALEDTIQKINKTTQKKLEEAFEGLNAKFMEVFTMLFGKGKAELQLTEGSILEAGIEIVAQPPGKRLQNLMLLSGGEKALTALSLLFAGFMIKPTPLCLLDEVDAPLDESNTERFTKLLKELANNIQFITITHNRRTMEAADYLYGITMEEPGSSKAVSMHLAESV